LSYLNCYVYQSGTAARDIENSARDSDNFPAEFKGFWTDSQVTGRPIAICYGILPQ
jgi:hypothetical protein